MTVATATKAQWEALELNIHKSHGSVTQVTQGSLGVTPIDDASGVQARITAELAALKVALDAVLA